MNLKNLLPEITLADEHKIELDKIDKELDHLRKIEMAIQTLPTLSNMKTEAPIAH